MSRETANRVFPDQISDSEPAASRSDFRLRSVRGSKDADGSGAATQTTVAEAQPLAEQKEPPAARAPEGDTALAAGAEEKPRRSRKPIFIGVGAIVALAAAWFGYQYITVGRYIVSTDDAYVGADMALISPKVPAYVSDVPIVENQPVKKGDVLVRLDSGDYQLALDQAQAKLATQNANITTFEAQIRAADATAEQARAQLDSAKATVLKTEADYQRTSALTAKDYSTKAALDAAIAARDSARAQVKSNEAAIQAADANIVLLHAQRDQAKQLAKELKVTVNQAERDLSFTIIRAPFNGVIGNKNVQVGDYVTPGKRLAAVVPLDKVYVDANLKETQLATVKAGQEAEVSIDALDGQKLKGTVESVAPASGSQFSLLPPENATGNFTKIVQRVPVRIAVPASEAQGRLRPGLSVVVDIDTVRVRKPNSSTPRNKGPFANGELP
ncbi:hemolysin D [Hyphomicrobium methylovorum]|uniref:HlyD family secretion protein n=1 Tax=Hyphomicrobium methylovorum TaxID=84 RepID=UPI0015E73150|nr:HlyD family secretion protein [Hyphomicrobium methylovorum]MBA2125169.1 hemolysin D [Hyphomicrobium methylovorum]